MRIEQSLSMCALFVQWIRATVQVCKSDRIWNNLLILISHLLISFPTENHTRIRDHVSYPIINSLATVTCCDHVVCMIYINLQCCFHFRYSRRWDHVTQSESEVTPPLVHTIFCAPWENRLPKTELYTIYDIRNGVNKIWVDRSSYTFANRMIMLS
jgi:hypothetical protein